MDSILSCMTAGHNIYTINRERKTGRHRVKRLQNQKADQHPFFQRR